jgi:hypothetical protein
LPGESITIPLDFFFILDEKIERKDFIIRGKKLRNIPVECDE